MREEIREGYLDRFAEVADGLKLKKDIANKIANFIEVEIQTAKTDAQALNTGNVLKIKEKK